MFSLSKSIVAVILGGGAGTRLYPLTAARSKPAVPIAGKYRLVDIPISNCINSNINRIFVLTQFNSASLNKHIKNTYHFSAFSTGFVDILAAEQTPDNPGWYQGTADAVRQCLRHIANNDYEYVLILSGDQLYQMDFSDMIHAHRKKEADISIATIPVGDRDAPEFGIMKKDENNFITSFIEKPKREIIPSSINKYKVISYQYDGYWTDIGNIHSFFEANLALAKDIPPFNLFDNTKTVFTRAIQFPPGKVSGTTLEKTVLAEGCIVFASRIENSVLGIRSHIGHGSTIVNCYMMGADYYETLEQMEKDTNIGVPKLGIGERCYIKNAIIDKNCRIGNDVRINAGAHLENTDHTLYTVKDGIVVIKKGAILPNGFVI